MKSKQITLLSFLFLLSCKQENIELTTTDPVANPYPTGGVSLLPDQGLSNPKMKFHDGTVENNAPKLFNEVPNIESSEVSDWYVTQWKKIDILHPLNMIQNASDQTDKVYGVPLYSFPTRSGESHFNIYFDQAKSKYVYELYGEHGWLDTMGGSNLFLSAPLLKGVNSSLDSRIDLNFDAKIKSREASYSSSAAQSDGSVVSQFFGGFSLYYKDPNSDENYSVFMQIAYADSRNQKYLAPNKLEYRGCYKNDYGDKQIVYGNNAPNSLGGNGFIASAQPDSKLSSYSYNINKQLCNMISASIKCNDGSTHQFSSAAKNLKNWKITGFYTGIETQDALPLDNNVVPTLPGPHRGNTSLAVMLSDLKLMRYPNEKFLNCDNNPTTTPTTFCSPSTKKTCSIDNGLAEQVCNAEGSQYEGCKAISCNQGFVLNNGQCIANDNLITTGKFCSNQKFVKWQCGSVQSPGEGWIKVSNDCYHQSTTENCN